VVAFIDLNSSIESLRSYDGASITAFNDDISPVSFIDVELILEIISDKRRATSEIDDVDDDGNNEDKGNIIAQLKNKNQKIFKVYLLCVFIIIDVHGN
jgi:hypothetical protein